MTSSKKPRLDHERFGSISDPNLNGHVHYPNDIDSSLNESVKNKIRKNHADYNDNPPNVISFMLAIESTSGSLHSEFLCLLFLQNHRETVGFSADLWSSACTFYAITLNIDGSPLVSRITLNIDGAPLTSRSHTHTSHSQTSRLLTSSLSLGVPVPLTTQCM